MPAYVVAMMAIHDRETYRKYTALSPSIVRRYGGKFLTRGEEVWSMEGEIYKDRMVILEFPTKADVEACFKEDAEYLAAVQFRHSASIGRILVQEGGTNTENPDPNV
ncbi:hypothetical protein J3E69DRAFT_351012 [Trichoderma sp. SZMC 28015]